MISRKATERSDAGNPSYFPEGRQPRAQDGGGSAAGLASPVGASQRAVATGPRAGSAEQRPRRAQHAHQRRRKAGLAVLPGNTRWEAPGTPSTGLCQGLSTVAAEV